MPVHAKIVNRPNVSVDSKPRAGRMVMSSTSVAVKPPKAPPLPAVKPPARRRRAANAGKGGA